MSVWDRSIADFCQCGACLASGDRRGVERMTNNGKLPQTGPRWPRVLGGVVAFILGVAIGLLAVGLVVLGWKWFVWTLSF